jgi:hypothetical protein
MGNHASHFSNRRFGRKRNEGNRPQMKPPMCDKCEVPRGVVATVTMKNTRKATIRIVCNIGLQIVGHCVRQCGVFTAVSAGGTAKWGEPVVVVGDCALLGYTALESHRM